LTLRLWVGFFAILLAVRPAVLEAQDLPEGDTHAASDEAVAPVAPETPVAPEPGQAEIGRASCRDRVYSYV
jgi:hypothetical protein